MPLKNLWEVGKDIAFNPGIFKRINHSKMMHSAGLGQGKWRDGGFLIKFGVRAAKFGMSFIPIPAVKDVVSGAFELGAQKARQAYVSRNNKLAETTGSLQDIVKWRLKDASVEDWDRYRRKIAHAYLELHKAVEALEDANIASTSICNDVVRATYKYAYFHKRVQKMQEEMTGFEELINQTRRWIDEVEQAARTSDYHDRIAAFVAIANIEDPVAHKDCDSAHCAHSDKQCFWKNHPTLYKGLITTGRVIAEVAPIGDSFVSSDYIGGG